METEQERIDVSQKAAPGEQYRRRFRLDGLQSILFEVFDLADGAVAAACRPPFVTTNFG
jgi:hypothetical protein